MTPDTYRPGVCLSCSRPAPVLVLDGRGIEGEGCCKACVDRLNALMSADHTTDGPTGWWPGVESDHPDWY